MATHRLMDMDHETESQTEAGTLEPQASKETRLTILVFLKHILEISRFEIPILQVFWHLLSNTPDLNGLGVGRSAAVKNL